jgi:hypothetical protein
MDRVVLLAFLGIPILVVIDAAGGLFVKFDQTGRRLPSKTYWQSPPQTIPTYFVIEQTAERGA